MPDTVASSNGDTEHSAQVLPNGQPDGELVHAGADAVAAAFFEARRALAARAERGGDGRFVPANSDALGALGTRSARLLPRIDAWVADEESALLLELGGASEVSRQLRAVVQQLAKAQVREAISWRAMWEAGGPVTCKGHQRKLARQNEGDSERVVRFAEKLGFERRSRAVKGMTLEQFAAAEAQR